MTAAPSFTVSPEYLAAAEAAGLLHHIGNEVCVAGTYREPVAGELQCLVEYAAPALLADPPALLRALFTEYPECEAAVVRAPADTVPPPALEPLVTHLLYAAPHFEAPAGLRVTLDQDGTHDHQVAAWLSRAFADAANDRGHSPTSAAVTDTVQTLMASPDRRSYLVHTPDHAHPVGHATILTDAYDDVSATAFVELVDILIDSTPHTRPATNALVNACAQEASRSGLPLLGNVAHPRPSGGADPAARVVDSLCAKGWRVTHRYWFGERG